MGARLGFAELPPPYELPSGVVYFHDWRYVNHGQVGWIGPDGGRQPKWTTEPTPPLRYEPSLRPTGVHLAAQPARKTEPFLVTGDEDTLLFAGTVIHEDGLYRLWYDCWPAEHIGSDRYAMGRFNYVRYAESDDGEDWRFPELGLVERNGSRDNNLVFGPPLTPETGYDGGSVFKDPSAPDAQRYKMFYRGRMSDGMKRRYLAQRPDEVDALNWEFEAWQGMFGAVSPDGLQWSPLANPLVAWSSDTHNVCEYDPVLGQYVAYCRHRLFGRRSIGRMASLTFERFPLSEPVIWPGTVTSADELWYASAKTRMPGTTDYHVMFPMRWSIANDSFDFFLATSPDNRTWSFVPGGPVCEPGPPGEWDGGVVAPGVGLVDLPGDRMGIPLEGSKVRHKYPRRAPLGAVAWAWWPRGRLVALEAPEDGEFALWPLTVRQRRVYLNFKTEAAGAVRVEALGGDGQTIPGRSFEDCDWLAGDHLERAVTWGGNADIGHEAEGPVTLRFRLRCASLFSVRFG